MGLSISEIAAPAGIQPLAIRYYERMGLLPCPVCHEEVLTQENSSEPSRGKTVSGQRERSFYEAVSKPNVELFAHAVGRASVRDLINGVSMSLGNDDLAHYACPACKGSLASLQAGFGCLQCDRVYELRGGVPDFLLLGRTSTHPVLRNIHAIDRLAGIYETRFWYSQVLRLVGGKERLSLPQLTNLIQEMLSPVRGCVLDVACGPGTFGRRVATQSERVYGVDISLGMLAEGIKLAQRERVVNIRFARAQAESLPFGAAVFDAAICCGALHLFPDSMGALREIGRTLRPGGPLAILTVTSGTSGVLRFPAVVKYARRGGLRIFEPQELEHMLKEAGFESRRPVSYGCLLTIHGRKQ
jgi:SAM-dependent methyltransferase/uncharacterized protein YbaR (Trm112 family)